MKRIKDYLIITVGSVLLALSLNIFLIPNQIAAGGVSGIATILEYTLRWKPSVTVAVINIPLYLLAFFKFGDQMLARSIYGTAVLSLALEYLDFLPVLENEPLLAAISGGVLMGVGIGLVLLQNATTGGTDIVAKLLHTFFGYISVGTLILLSDALIILAAGVVFRNTASMIYAIIALYISTKIIDSIVEGVDFAKVVYIVSQKTEAISGEIQTKMARGVTGIRSVGMYEKTDGVMLLCVVRRYEVPKLKSIVTSVDKNAFVILSDAKEVLGEGFKII